MRVAALDLGTNTFHLLIGDWVGGTCTYVHRERCRVMLGREGIGSGCISEAAFVRATEAIRYLRTVWAHWQVTHVFVAATSVFRKASNGGELLQKLQNEAHITAQILTGEEEAHLIGAGVQEALRTTALSSYLVMDIGGGSTEFILVSGNQTKGVYSYEIGAQRLCERFSGRDPMDADMQSALSAYLWPMLSDMLRAISHAKPEHLVGTSGTFNTLYDVYAAQTGAAPRGKKQNLYAIPTPFFRKTLNQFITLPYQRRLALEGMPNERARLVPFGGFLIQWMCAHYAFAHQHLCTYALKEGLMRRGIQRLSTAN